MYAFLFLFLARNRNVIITNSHVEILIILPDTVNIHFYNKTLYQNIERKNPCVKFQYISYSNWDNTLKYLRDPIKPHMAVYRQNRFLEFFEPFSDYFFDQLETYVQSTYCSFVETLNETELSNYLRIHKYVFVLYNDHIYYEFEDNAFIYKYSKVKFVFVKGEFSLFFYNQMTEHFRRYDFTRSMSQFFKSCVVPKPPKMKDRIHFHTDQRFKMYAITNTIRNREIDDLFLSLSSKYYKNINYSIIEWEKAQNLSLKQLCQISQNDLTYIVTTKKDNIDFCWLYPDTDIKNPELIEKFLLNSLNGRFYINYFTRFTPYSLMTPDEQKNGANFQKLIPDDENTVLVFFTNSKSLSNEYANECLTYVMNKLRLLNIKFIQFNPKFGWTPPYVPTTDGFPMFVIWQPKDRQPHVFRTILTPENLLEFALKYVKK
ncbi:hypothetical protein TRFO_31627 [Tritrichomonas foetus]|uniref:Thioredoxin domain-containing protein n=1 Tax=Tritrichomonas foetus TaxID=1144522 RepID=A0A1J4JQS5_9EUKA|nr:hypothetical protein TRFO_31627 [Tritrichomonas foetus]|eukprot:OHT01527.1 hypothetical protein TRFO_31627 [Tritrichomonas foetus]